MVITITADTIEVRNGAAIGMANSFGGGPFPTGVDTLTINGNNMTLSSDGSPRFTAIGTTGYFHPAYGKLVQFFRRWFGGDSASVTINLTGNLTVRENARITTDNVGFGSAGAITVNAANILFVGAGPGTGLFSAQGGLESGSITLSATLSDKGKIDVENGFRISAATLGSGSQAFGPGGRVVLNAGESITLTGPGSSISTTTQGSVDSGSIDLRSNGTVQISNGAEITANSGGGAGRAGTVRIIAGDQIVITGSSISTTTQGSGDSGSIALLSNGTVQISNGSVLTADSRGSAGEAGNIGIFTNDQIVITDGSVSTRAVQSDGGNIFLDATNLIRLTNSQITSSVESGFGGGGNIIIFGGAGAVPPPTGFVLLNNSQIRADAFGGPGGNVTIVGDFLRPTVSSAPHRP